MTAKLHRARRGVSMQLLELTISLACMGAVLAVVVPQVPVMMSKARLTDALMQAGSYRVSLMEQMAVTGEGYPLQTVELATTAQDSIDAEIGRKLSIPTFMSSSKGGARESSGVDSKNEEKKDALANQQAFNKFGKFEANVVDQDIIFSGTLGANRRQFFLRFTPSVIADGPPGSVLWLCGRHAALPGWTQPASAGSDLPAELLFSTCR